MMNEEERKIAKTMSDYATTEKEKIFKEMKLQSVMGVCALVLYWILHETGAYMYNDVLGKLAGYCETLVSVSVIMMAAFTTGSLSKVRSKSRKVFVFENFPKPMQLVVAAVVAFEISVSSRITFFSPLRNNLLYALSHFNTPKVPSD